MLCALFICRGEGVSPLRRRSRSLIFASLLLPVPNMLADGPIPVCCSGINIAAAWATGAGPGDTSCLQMMQRCTQCS